MKKLLTFASAFLTAASLFAAVAVTNPGDTSLVEFYTNGPDTYEDGTPVVEGETYLFVYLPEGTTFSIDTQGKPGEGVEILGQAAAIKHPDTGVVRCPNVEFNYSTKKYEKGSFHVVLLDTRINATTAGGFGFVDKFTLGVPSAVNASEEGETPSFGKVLASASSVNAIGASDLQQRGSSISLLEDKGIIPEIKGIVIGADSSATVTIDKTGPGWYTVLESATPGSGWQNAGADKVKGNGESVDVTVPASTAKVRFFKVFAK